MKEVKKKYRKYVRECNVELKYKDGREEYLVMDLDLNDSVDDQICARFGEANLKRWSWFEVNGPSMEELRDMFFGV